MTNLTFNFAWQQYKLFHAQWEVMKCALFHGETISVHRFYTSESYVGMDTHTVETIPDNLNFVVQCKKGVKALSGRYRM